MTTIGLGIMLLPLPFLHLDKRQLIDQFSHVLRRPCMQSQLIQLLDELLELLPSFNGRAMPLSFLDGSMQLLELLLRQVVVGSVPALVKTE